MLMLNEQLVVLHLNVHAVLLICSSATLLIHAIISAALWESRRVKEGYFLSLVLAMFLCNFELFSQINDRKSVKARNDVIDILTSGKVKSSYKPSGRSLSLFQ